MAVVRCCRRQWDVKYSAPPAPLVTITVSENYSLAKFRDVLGTNPLSVIVRSEQLDDEIRLAAYVPARPR